MRMIAGYIKNNQAISGLMTMPNKWARALGNRRTSAAAKIRWATAYDKDGQPWEIVPFLVDIYILQLANFVKYTIPPPRHKDT
jgi:hypothetical protein